MDYCERLISDPKHDWVVRDIKIVQVENKLEICQSRRAQFLFGLQSRSSGHAYDNKRISILFLSFYLNYSPTMAQYGDMFKNLEPLLMSILLRK